VVAADQFGSAPLLVRSNPGFKTLALAAAGVCEPGDRFVLATDAVAARLFKSSANGPGPEWEQFESITEETWRDDLDTLRRANDMVNDDCTLVVLRVSGASEGPNAIEVSEAATAIVEAASPLEPQSRSDLPSAVSEASEEQAESEAASAPPATGHLEDFAIAADVGDLMVDLPHDLPQSEWPAETPDSPEQNDSPPADEPPAARDGFPESTDNRD
jgi:hypothetical protein